MCVKISRKWCNSETYDCLSVLGRLNVLSFFFSLKCIFKCLVLSFCLSLYFSCVECFGRAAPDETIIHPLLLLRAWGEGIKHMFPFLRGSTRCSSIPISELRVTDVLLSFFTLAFTDMMWQMPGHCWNLCLARQTWVKQLLSLWRMN